MQAVLVFQRELSCTALFVSVLRTASDAAHRSRMGLLSLYSSVGLAEGGLNKAGAVGLQERGKARGGEKGEQYRGKVNKDGTWRRGCIRDGLLGSVY